MPLIDEKSARSILGWMNENKRIFKNISIINDSNPLKLRVENDEIKILEFILKKNKINYTIEDINSISKN